MTGAVEGARVLLIGQAPGPHEVELKQPFAYTAGRKLFSWFATLGVREETFRERVYIGAVIRCFPGKDAKGGGDRVPDLLEIANCSTHLEREIRLLEPALIIAVGTLAAKQIIGLSELKTIVGVAHRGSRFNHDFKTIVLPHPSGRSTWLNKPEHLDLLNKSLQLIANDESWKQTFR